MNAASVTCRSRLWRYPDIDPVAFRLGPLAVHWYGLAYLAASSGAYSSLRWLASRWELGLSDDDLLTILLCADHRRHRRRPARLRALLRRRLLSVSSPAQILAIWDGGMSFHGGLAGILVAGVVVARMLRMPWLTLCDLGAVGAPIGFVFGRLANFVNGELWGRVTDVPVGDGLPGSGPAAAASVAALRGAARGCGAASSSCSSLARKLPPRPRGELLGWLLTLYGVVPDRRGVLPASPTRRSASCRLALRWGSC